jgi:hypothetical protein
LQVALANDVTYRTQPHREHVVVPVPGAGLVYLRVFTSEVSSADDQALANPGDVKFETALRDRIDWEVLVSAAPIVAPDHCLLATIAGAAMQDRRRTGLTLAATRDELTAARGTSADLAARIGTVIAPDGSLGRRLVTVANLATTAALEGSISVPAATPTGPGEATALLQSSKAPPTALFLVSAWVAKSSAPPGNSTWIEWQIREAFARAATSADWGRILVVRNLRPFDATVGFKYCTLLDG